MQTGEWSDPSFAAIAKALHASVGLVFPVNRRESAEAGMRRAMSAACISDPRDLLRAVAAAGETRDALITDLTVGETFFFREPGQFDFIRTSVLPALRETIGQRRLRMWSAGCATGEEPYTLAMLLKEAAWPGAASILGTDLAAARLATARRGRYTAWSMRGVSETIISRYFERRAKQFILRPDIRRAVDFRVLNLASREYPSTESGIQQMDVVLCRNVLIYFDLSTVAAIATRLIATLAPGGWLFLGASDPSIAELVPCEVVMTGAGLAYRPEGTTEGVRPAYFDGSVSWTRDASGDTSIAASPPPDAWIPAESAEAVNLPVAEETRAAAPDESAEPHDSYESAYDQGDYDAAARLARSEITGGNDDEAVWVVLVRSLANRGQLDAAGEACAAALEKHGLAARLVHLHAVLLAEAGRYAEAVAAARRALYLDSGYAVAHLALGDALARTADPSGARRAFANAESILKRLDPATPVPGADGAEASQLLGIARFRLGALQGSAATGAGAGAV